MNLTKLPFGEVKILKDGTLYFRHDFYLTQDDLDAGLEPEDEYRYCVEMLKGGGLEFVDAYIEHDCISGDIDYIDGD